MRQWRRRIAEAVTKIHNYMRRAQEAEGERDRGKAAANDG